MQADPAGYQDGPNWYLYVQDDPTNKTDPTGRFQNCPNMKNCIESDTYKSDSNHVPSVNFSDED